MKQSDKTVLELLVLGFLGGIFIGLVTIRLVSIITGV